LIVTIVAFCMWIHRVYRNLPALGAGGLRFSPRNAVGGWFVPILNWWYPYKVVREVWQQSAPAGQGWALLKVWWALWLLANYVATLVYRLGGSNDVLDAITNAIVVAAAISAILVVRRISTWQEEKAGRDAIQDRQAESHTAGLLQASVVRSPAARFCENCGATWEPGNFCTYCGAGRAA
jgi:hypothetical protein